MVRRYNVQRYNHESTENLRTYVDTTCKLHCITSYNVDVSSTDARKRIRNKFNCNIQVSFKLYVSKPSFQSNFPT